MSAMRRKTKVKTLRRRRAVLETVELEGEESTISHRLLLLDHKSYISSKANKIRLSEPHLCDIWRPAKIESCFSNP
ncbi:hypothetical protein VNO80_08268 [Phaseolus coccineus]|uniref:Uncharacterized protein n=1 Tax=Phaseolus coccineus TaxID=3886 RepID=A0AAN9RJ91_PHACN